MRRVSLLLGLLLSVFIFSNIRTSSAASVTPTFVSGNPTCQDLGYEAGFKPNSPSEANPVGTHTLPDGVNTVTISIDGSGVDWTSTLGMDAVIVKGGPNANVYAYDPPAESFGDTNLVTPTNSQNNQPYGLSHLVFCYDYEVQVSKTAVTTFNRDWDWTIDKSCDKTALTLAMGESFNVNCSVGVDADSTDSNWAVSGNITVFNPAPVSATITSVTDAISGFGSVSVNCPVSLPYSLAAHASLVCSYSTGLPDAVDRTNTATVTTTGSVEGGSGQASVTFGSVPAVETDECTTVDDDQYGSLGQVCAADAPKTFNYVQVVGPYVECGDHQFINTATFTTNDSETTGSDSWTVNVTVPCILGCTLTQGYWKTHSDRGPAPYDDNWALLPGGMAEDTAFFSSGQTWYQVFWTAPKGNPYYVLAHQYMAAQLNKLNGASTTPTVNATLASAAAFFSSHTPSSNLSKTEKAQLTNWAGILASYNEGQTGPGHCSE